MTYIMRYLTRVCDEKLREKFLKEGKPTVKLLDKIAHQHELTESSVKAMSSQRADLRQVTGGNKQQKPKIPSSKDLMDQGKCIRCGTAGHSAPDSRHKTSLCHGCQKQGHLKRVCQTLRKGNSKMPANKARAVTQAQERDPGEESLPPEYDSETEQKPTDVTTRNVMVRQVPPGGNLTPRIQVLINDTIQMAACADTGTNRTIISHNMVRKHGLKMYRANERLLAANGERMSCEGKVPLKVQFQGK